MAEWHQDIKGQAKGLSPQSTELRRNLAISLRLLSVRLCPKSSGAMLLLVTLAFLAGSTCRAQNILGNNVGTYFYAAGEDHGELRGVRIFLTAINLIKGIQFQFGNYWSQVYGTRSLQEREFLLEHGEHVTKVSGTRKLCLTSLSFTTDKGRVASFGARGGLFFYDSGGSDKHLVAVNGLYAPGLCIKGMGFKWKDTHDGSDNNDDDKEVDDDDNDDDNEKDRGDKDNDKDDDDDHDDDNKEDKGDKDNDKDDDDDNNEGDEEDDDEKDDKDDDDEEEEEDKDKDNDKDEDDDDDYDHDGDDDYDEQEDEQKDDDGDDDEDNDKDDDDDGDEEDE